MTTSAPLRDAPVEALPQPYLLFLGDATEPSYAKTAFGLRDWAGERCVGEWSARRDASRPACRGCRRRKRAHAAHAPRDRRGQLRRRDRRELDSVAGRGARRRGSTSSAACTRGSATTPALKAAASRYGRRLIDIRTPPRNIPIGHAARSAAASGCSPSAPTARSARSTRPWRSRGPSPRAASTSISAPPDRPAS